MLAAALALCAIAACTHAGPVVGWEPERARDRIVLDPADLQVETWVSGLAPGASSTVSLRPVSFIRQLNRSRVEEPRERYAPGL